MSFHLLIKRLTIDILFFAAFLLSVFFIFSQMTTFMENAISLGYVNIQAISYLAYTVLLAVFPFFLVLHYTSFSKRQVLRIICYSFSAVIILGTTADLFTYNFFKDYTYFEGEMIFINIVWNTPNIFGAAFSLLMAVLWAMLGKNIKKRRKASCFLYIAIFLLSSAVPFMYSFAVGGTLPRQTYLQKAIIIIPQQLLVMIALIISASSRRLWQQHIWNH